MILPVIEFPESFFTKGENYVLVSEASDMQNRHLQILRSDTRDVGFNVKFATGQVVTFALSNVMKDKEHEILAWEYTTVHGRKALVFND